MAERNSPGDEAGRVESAMLDRIRPTQEVLDRVARASARLVAAGTETARRLGVPLVRCLVAGSAARGTFLSDRLDIDFFMLFPPTLARSELERVGLQLGRELLESPETRYAEHPYYRGRFDGFQVDAVPGYAIDDPSRPLTAVDRTPFHQDYLATRLTPALVDQVRLTKQFLRAIEVYGSEARRGGFSGYLVELLVLRFGSLRALLTEAQGWRIPVRFLSKPGAAARVPEDVGLVMDDPVDAHRNVATALTRRNLATLILAAGWYLEHPSAEAFETRARSPPTLSRALEEVHARSTHVASLSLPRPAVVDDILYPQLRKAERAVAEEARRLGFSVLGASSAAGTAEVVVLVEVEHRDRPVVRVHDGPPAGIDRTGSFLGKWGPVTPELLQGPYVTEDGRLAVEARRTERRLEPLLTDSIGHLPLGRDLRAHLPEGARFRALSDTEESPHLREALAELLEKRLPWLSARDR